MAEFHRSAAYAVAQVGDWTVRILVGVESDTEESPWDFEVEDRNGQRYVGVVATLAQLAAIMQRWQTTGECLSGLYLWISDLVVLDTLEPQLLALVVQDLAENGELDKALNKVLPTD